jgi:hypothetical protein
MGQEDGFILDNLEGAKLGRKLAKVKLFMLIRNVIDIILSHQ